MSEHKAWAIMAPWRSREAKTVKKARKQAILDQNPLLFWVILAWYYYSRCYRAGQHRKQLGYHVWAQHMGHNGPLAAERGQKQQKWAKMSQNERFWRSIYKFLAAQGARRNHLTPLPPPGNPYLAPTRKYRPKRPSSDREKSKTVKNSENEQKWPF